jgi:hypothetical protein
VVPSPLQAMEGLPIGRSEIAAAWGADQCMPWLKSA